MSESCACVLCDPPGGEVEPVLRRMIDHIGNVGWGVIMIPADADGPGWAFTIGLWHSHRMPELAMFGLDVELMHALLNDLAGNATTGSPAADGQERLDVTAGRPVVLKSVRRGWYRAFLGTALRFYRRPPLPVLQIVWPDRENRFPWDDGASADYRARQPHLWLDPADHAPGVWTQDL